MTDHFLAVSSNVSTTRSLQLSIHTTAHCSVRLLGSPWLQAPF